MTKTFYFNPTIPFTASSPEKIDDAFLRRAEKFGIRLSRKFYFDTAANHFQEGENEFVNADGRSICSSDDVLVLDSDVAHRLTGEPYFVLTKEEADKWLMEGNSNPDQDLSFEPEYEITDDQYRDAAIRACIYMEHGVKDGSKPVRAENVAGDKGGLTKYGISKAAFPDVDIANLTYDEAVHIYATRMWPDSKASLVPRPLSAMLFDLRVTSGPKNAIRVLQRAVGAGDDGIWGAKTKLAAEKACSTIPKMLWATQQFTERRIAFYQAIVAANSSQGKFLNGWINRAVRSQTYAQALLHTLDIL